jgi:hypothetical protein
MLDGNFLRVSSFLTVSTPQAIAADTDLECAEKAFELLLPSIGIKHFKECISDPKKMETVLNVCYGYPFIISPHSHPVLGIIFFIMTSIQLARREK